MNHINFSVSNYFKAHADLASKLNINMFNAGIDLIRKKFVGGKKIITCGNGGSASTASHFVNDLLTAYTYEQTAERPFTHKKAKVQSLTESTGIVTGLTNDFNFDDIFVNQLRTVSDVGDVLVIITASGNSQNLLNAVSYANENGIFTVAIVGFDGGKVSKTAQLVIHAKTDNGDYGPAEDVHLVINHAVASLIRDKLYRK